MPDFQHACGIDADQIQHFYVRMFSMVLASPSAVLHPSVEEFRKQTESKLDGIHCPHHRKAPQVIIRGTSLRDATVQISGCCDRLIQLANVAIAR